ncbi:hypothetical protein Vretimale_5000 [Volvox reticuliferus]|uniref:Uncharacterized protein n=1 Tax=Volvox reticuliferus TaxID=1737510 RepID=A0A8J4DDL8_9CHLO|nr:hypothetical protein Vretifemale_4103 [Volvox reticuliferus]GIL99957.1 hypothetical protein Vretimale_5000 [Volvox reticuliferus]
MREQEHKLPANSATFKSQIELTSKARVVTNRDGAITHALADALTPELAETDDCSLEPLATAAGVRRRTDAAATQCIGPIGEFHSSSKSGDPSTSPRKGNLPVGSKSGSSRGVGDDGYGGSSSALYPPRSLEGDRAAEVAGLAVGPLLAARMPWDSYGGVPAEQHGVDVRQLQQQVTPIEPSSVDDAANG